MTLCFKLFYFILLQHIFTSSTDKLLCSKNQIISKIFKITEERDFFAYRLNEIKNEKKQTRSDINVRTAQLYVKIIFKSNAEIMSAQSELREIEQKIRNNDYK